MSRSTEPKTVPRPHFRAKRQGRPDNGQACTASNSRRIASNFACLSVAEVVCRATSVIVTLSLTEKLGRGGFGRIEFGFNVVFWLVLIVRDGFEVIASRELARHRQLVRPLVNHILAVKVLLATSLYALLAVSAFLTMSGVEERAVLCTYGLLLFTTALGLDFVYRGLERMGLVAISLVLRTSVYAIGVLMLVGGTTRLVWVPAWLVLGEAVGIALVWAVYARKWGLPRPALRSRFTLVILKRGRPVLAIYLAQTVLTTVDMMIVGLLSTWSDNGLYSAPQRLIAAVLTLGVIFQQVVFPTLARSWRMDAAGSKQTIDRLVRLLVMALLPMAIGASVLAVPIAGFLFPRDYEGAAALLAIGIWRAPLLTIAFLYQSSLIALNKVVTASRFLFLAAALAPLAIVLGLKSVGLMGASIAMVVVSGGLWLATYRKLAAEGRAPAWHHHLARPLIASLLMVLVAVPVARINVVAAIAAGGLAYLAGLRMTGALTVAELKELFPSHAAGPETRVKADLIAQPD